MLFSSIRNFILQDIICGLIKNNWKRATEPLYTSILAASKINYEIMASYNPQKIEKKWQKIWLENKFYQVKDRVSGKENFYHLVMFPYPSGDLHIGHWYNYAPADVYARKKRMEGFNVLSPIGFDAFGLPAENAAIRHKIHPRIWTFRNIERMRKQLRSIGGIYDWSREVITADPEYYKWTQWFFIQFFKKGLAYRHKTAANWCPKCKTILANEQIVNGRCERCEAVVVQKEIEQWLFKITVYADQLLKDLKNLDWPEQTKLMQKNWIGRSEGALIKFPLADSKFKIKTLEVFTTRPETIFGATYVVLAPEHPLVEEIIKLDQSKKIKDYVARARTKTERQRLQEQRVKTGVPTGIFVLNPATQELIPVWVADYVLIGYGTGAIMAVPAHDERDFEFAKKYKLPIKEVVSPDGKKHRLKKAYVEDGVLIDSGEFSSLFATDAKEKVIEWLERKNFGQRTVNYKLRDWIISRQRYWGVPIPMVNCQKCGWVSVPEKDLPVLLPEIKDFTPPGDGTSPLSRAKDWVQTKCPQCGGQAQRETDTMDTFVDSSWYFLRYIDPHNQKSFASSEKLKAWLPVKMYVGGAEHTVMHLLYARFFIKVLYDLKLINFKEPFLSLRHQGIILGEDGNKMSKSRGNVVDPDYYVKRYGADTVRTFLCFMADYDQGGPWSSQGINGIFRFLNRVWDLIWQVKDQKFIHQEEKLLYRRHQTIKKVSDDIENFRFNTAVAALMEYVNELSKNKKLISRKDIETLVILLAPFAPHLAEELWQEGLAKKGSVHKQSWPTYDQRYLKEKEMDLVIQIDGRVRAVLKVPTGLSEEKAKDLALQVKKIRQKLKGQEVVKVIFTGQIINFVTKH